MSLQRRRSANFSRNGASSGPRDYVHPAAQTPLTDNLLIEYSPAVPVRLITASGTKTIITTADDVGALLEEQGIELGKHDIVRPSLADPIVAYANGAHFARREMGCDGKAARCATHDSRDRFLASAGTL